MTRQLVDVARVRDLHPHDLVDEGVYIHRIESGPVGGDRAFAAPMVGVAERVALRYANVCVLQPTWDHDATRVLTSADMPMRVVRGEVSPPIRCELDITACERCPRVTSKTDLHEQEDHEHE